jgi:hypothetical protein
MPLNCGAPTTQLFAAPRTNFSGFVVRVVGIPERWFRFACGFGRGRCAVAFSDMPLSSELGVTGLYNLAMHPPDFKAKGEK